MISLLLFRHEFLRRKEKRLRFKTLRYKYLVLPAQLGSDGRETVLRISTHVGKVRTTLSCLFTRINHYVPLIDLICTAFGNS
jgi:hypothetical protein